ncbi:hypothetical protein K435DRAFT_788885 [Dendrothele bispora CBS 962.96]|uniref:Uncharacterized protein n=1 Tax=Dendrothele bispora (strain CBS 962.96) TaxID=1314807 RepID=A0A4S8MVF9_DENBC|nr:hypothetical protein K435DRAFT_788885 [Dendrothele bispora CBS 962.96]
MKLCVATGHFSDPVFLCLLKQIASVMNQYFSSNRLQLWTLFEPCLLYQSSHCLDPVFFCPPPLPLPGSHYTDPAFPAPLQQIRSAIVLTQCSSPLQQEVRDELLVASGHCSDSVFPCPLQQEDDALVLTQCSLPPPSDLGHFTDMVFCFHQSQAIVLTQCPCPFPQKAIVSTQFYPVMTVSHCSDPVLPLPPPTVTGHCSDPVFPYAFQQEEWQPCSLYFTVLSQTIITTFLVGQNWLLFRVYVSPQIDLKNLLLDEVMFSS